MKSDNHKVIEICASSVIKETIPKGFEVEGITLILIRANGKILGYQNSCPHLGIELNWAPDRFLDPEGKHIQCSMHGALFRFEDGYCIEGPCAGQSLKPVEIIEKDERLYLSNEK